MADPDESLPEGGGPAILAAVEEFVSLHSRGFPPELEVFCSRFPEAIRAEIHKQCEVYLDFEGLVGRQVDPTETGDGSGAGAETDEPAHPSDGPMRLGDFAIEDELGRGGMGVVYRATQISLGRQVALKILPAGLSLSSRHVEWFRREASSAARLRHPGIVPIYAFGEVKGTHYFAMEYVPGKDLAEILGDLRGEQPSGETRRVTGRLGTGRGASHAAEVAELIAGVAAALACAHEAGIVHRDLKPRNIVLDREGEPRLLDFGLAKDIGTESLSLPGELAGTPHYMSPEQTLAKRAPVDHRTDIFSLGVILYELLTLKQPFAFDGKNLQQIIYEICFAEPAPIHKLNHQAPRDLATICMKALEKSPSARYQTAAEMEADLRRFLRHEPIQARPAGRIARAIKWTRRHRSLTLGTAAAVLAIVGLLGWDWYRVRRNQGRAQELMQQAGRSMEEGDLAGATSLALDAQALLPDDLALRARVKDIQLVQEETLRELAEARGLFADSAMVLPQDKELALILALEGAAKQEQAGPMARRAVLAALEARYESLPLLGHDNEVHCFAISPDGRRLATGSIDNTARIWDAADGSLLSTLEGHQNWVVDVEFSPDGTRLVTASNDGTARVWDVEEGIQVSRLEGHRGQLFTAAFGPDGTRIVTSSNDRDARVWDAASGRCELILEGHTDRVYQAIFSPDGNTIATASRDHTSRLLDARTGAELHVLGEQHGAVIEVEFSPDGSVLAVASVDNMIRLYSVPDGALLHTLGHSGPVRSVAFSPGGERLLTASYDNTARLWDVQSGTELMVLLHDDQVHRAEFSADGELLVTSSADHIVRVFDAATGDELARLDHDSPVYGAVFYPDNRRVVTLTPGDGSRGARIWDLQKGRQVIRLRHGENVYSARFDRSGERVLTGSLDYTARIWSAVDGRLLREFKEPDAGNANGIYFADFDPAGDRVVTAAREVARIWDTRDGSLLQTLTTDGMDRVDTAFFSEDGEWVVTASRDNAARIWGSRTGTVHHVFRRPTPIYFASLSRDGERLVTVENDYVARVWDVDGEEQILVLRGHEDHVTSAVFSPDGRGILTASRDRTARLWDSETGAQLQTFVGHESRVDSATFSNDGRRVLTASRDGTARLWDAETGEPLLIFAGHGSGVRWASLSPDGDRAISGSLDNTARIWPTNPLELARGMKLRELTYSERERFQLLRDVDLEARARVEELFDEWQLAPDVIARLNQDASLDPRVRELAIGMARERGNPTALALSQSWEELLSPEVEPEAARQILRRADALVRMQPDDPRARAILGAAQYRAGRYGAAVANLLRSQEMRALGPGELAFLSMAYRGADQPARARATLEALDAMVDTMAAEEPDSADRIPQSLLEEVRSLVGRD